MMHERRVNIYEKFCTSWYPSHKTVYSTNDRNELIFLFLNSNYSGFLTSRRIIWTSCQRLKEITELTISALCGRNNSTNFAENKKIRCDDIMWWIKFNYTIFCLFRKYVQHVRHRKCHHSPSFKFKFESLLWIWSPPLITWMIVWSFILEMASKHTWRTIPILGQ